MGRRKIAIKPIRDDRNRSVTFLKRKGGLFKKAHELSVLCSVDVAVVIFGHNKKLYEYSSSDINEIIGRFQYYGGAHEHKGPQDFADKGGGGDDDDEEDAGDDAGGDDQRGTPAPDHPMMQHPGVGGQMSHHPGFQHVARHGTPSGSPPMHNGGMPQFNRAPSPLPPGMSRPTSRNAQHPAHHQAHIRRTSSNLGPQGQPQPTYAYAPNQPFYSQQAQMQAPSQQPVQQPGSYPPPYPPSSHPQMQQQQAFMQDSRQTSMPQGYPQQPPPQANMQRHPSQEHLHPQQQPGQPSPRIGERPTPSPQPPQNEFASPQMPQPRPMPAHAKSHSIFTPIDDSRSLLAQHWGATGNSDMPRSEALIKLEGGGPRSASIDVAQMQRDNQARANGSSTQIRPPPSRHQSNSPNPPPQRTASTPAAGPARVTAGPDAKRPRLKVQIPSEQSGDEGGSGSGIGDDTSEPQTSNPAGVQAQGQPSIGVHLPPPSPSAGALLSAGAQGPPNPFARPAPPMSTNPHAANREAASSHVETPISALPSRFMSDNLLPSPSTFYPEWGFGRSGDNNMLPSPLNFQTPVVPNGSGWREEERKRAAEEQDGGDPKRAKS